VHLLSPLLFLNGHLRKTMC